MTGAVSGLGKAITRELASRGWEIATVDSKGTSDQVWCDLDREVLSGGEASASPFDVRDVDSWRRCPTNFKKNGCRRPSC